MFSLRSLVVVVIAGVTGTIFNAIAVNILTGTPVMPLILSPGRLAVAILVALLLIPVFSRGITGTGWLLALVLLTVIPSLLAVFVFGAAAPWGFVLGVNLVYAVLATLVFAVSADRPRRRTSHIIPPAAR